MLFICLKNKMLFEELWFKECQFFAVNGGDEHGAIQVVIATLACRFR